MRIRIILSDKEFIIRVIVHNTKENNLKPGYVCESDVDLKIYASASELVNETYKKYFKGGARSSGTNVLGFDDEKMVEQLQVDVSFFPFKIVTNGITVFVASIGSSDQEELNFAGSGYQSSFHYRYLRNCSLLGSFKNNQGDLTITDINEGEEKTGSNEEESSIHGKKQKIALDINNTNEHFTKHHKKS